MVDVSSLRTSTGALEWRQDQQGDERHRSRVGRGSHAYALFSFPPQSTVCARVSLTPLQDLRSLQVLLCSTTNTFCSPFLSCQHCFFEFL
jgi:hypothetical protein